MIITLGSVRGAPGVTSWSLLLAAAWPADVGADRVVLEADPAGGVLGARYGWGVEPGLVELVSRLRRDSGGRTVAIEGAERRVAENVSVIPAPETSARARTLWQLEAANVALRLAADARVWFVDVGRISQGDPTIPFVDHASMFVLVSGGRPEDLVQLPTHVQMLRQHCDRFALLVTGPCSYSIDELKTFVGVDTGWAIKKIEELVEDAVNSLVDSRSRRRSMLWRGALEISSTIAAEVLRAGDSPRIGLAEATR